jgi:hypothetical protein
MNQYAIADPAQSTIATMDSRENFGGAGTRVNAGSIRTGAGGGSGFGFLDGIRCRRRNTDG